MADRCAAVGGKELASATPRIRSPWYETKPKSLFLITGKPALAPNWFCRSKGTVGVKKFRAFSDWLRKNSKPLP